MIHQRLNIKPLSVNKAWQGRRYKTKEYKNFEKNMLLMLKNTTFETDNKLSVSIVYGFSSKASDIDNPTKLVLDIMQKKYGFNDSRVYELTLRKEIVKKGQEFIDIEVKEL